MSSCAAESQPPCPSDPLRGIYQPARLEVLGECMWFQGVVRSIDQRRDGDFHLEVAPASGFEDLLSDANEGVMVVEIVPGQHLRLPEVGERIGVFGTWVFDSHNEWNEIHPVWSIDYPERGIRADVLPPATPLYEGDEDD